MQPLGLGGEGGAVIAIQPIGDQQDHRPLPQRAAPPLAVEGVQAMADARAAGPILDGAADAGQGGVHVIAPQVPGDVGEPRPEQEGEDSVAVVGQGVQEMEQHARVAVHGARDVAQHHQGRRARAPPALHEPDEVAPRAARRAQCGAHVGALAGDRRTVAPGRNLVHRQAHAAHFLARRPHLVRRHLLEVLVLQDFVLAPRHDGVDLYFLRRLSGVVGLRLRLPRRQGFGDAARQFLVGGQPLFAAHCRQDEPHHALQDVGVAPEHVKGLVEQVALIAPVDEDGVQGPIEIATALDTDRGDGAHGVDHPSWPDGQPRRPQHPGEVGDVFHQAAAGGLVHGVQTPAWASSALTSPMRRLASLPWILAMSS